MTNDYAFFEYQAKITNAGHAENEGEPVHCMIKMKSLDEHGKRRRNVELEQQAGDNVLFVINPAPHKRISHSSILSVCLSAKKLFKRREQRQTSIAWETARSFSTQTESSFPPHQSFRFRRTIERNAEHPHMSSCTNGCWNLGKPVLGIWAASVPFRSPVS